MAEDPKKVSNNNLQGSQFDGGLIDAETVNANQIGDTVNHITLIVQIESMMTPLLENIQTSSDPRRSILDNFLNQLGDEAKKKESRNITKNAEYGIEKVFKVETIYAHYAITSYLKPIRVRCNLTLSTASATLEAIDITGFYDDEYL
ncbi:hypothetical protein [Lyngbya aestuarii]|uniref:hypothetical protein n=1 Tax=Lyngbya aestuarii TaxID=118322 RepID=UPI00403DD59F